MFRINSYYNRSGARTATPWWIMVMLLGITGILVGVLIFIFPELLAYIVATFFLAGGIFMLVVSLMVRNMNRQDRKHQTRVPAE